MAVKASPGRLVRQEARVLPGRQEQRQRFQDQPEPQDRLVPQDQPEQA